MNNIKTHYEMANADKPEEIILATQRSIMAALDNLFLDIKKETDAPGLLWEQIFEILRMMKEKKPTVIFQDRVQ